MMPEGISDRTCFCPSITSVWPALCPPWKRATAAARAVSRSTTLPLPSSPHCVPMTTTKRPMFGLFYFDLTKNNRTRPASMLIRPATRSSRSDIRASCSNTRRVAWGFRNGSSPSSTSRMDTAASRSVQAKCTPVNPLAPARRIQVLEELAFGRYDPDIAIARQRAAIRLQAAVEGIELRRLAVGLRVDARSQAITLAAQALGIARRIGKDFRDLAVRLGADAFAVGAALGAQLV